jgi:hypothetical protein
MRSCRRAGRRVLYCRHAGRAIRYLRELFIEVNLVFSLPPMPFTTAIIASEIPAAIRPYSIAVAPDSSAKNLRMTFTI